MPLGFVKYETYKLSFRDAVESRWFTRDFGEFSNRAEAEVWAKAEWAEASKSEFFECDNWDLEVIEHREPNLSHCD